MLAMELENIKDHLIFSCLAGSHAYGMATPASDEDIRGVFVLPEEHLLSPFDQVEQVAGEGDTVHFELRKYLRLVATQNPNILEMLWLDDDFVLHGTQAWSLVRDRRVDLLSRQVGDTFGNYAISQMKRMKSHNKWINKPQPEDPPQPRQFISVVHDMSMDRRVKRLRGDLPQHGYQAVLLPNDHFLLFEREGKRWYDDSGALVRVKRNEAVDLQEGRQPLAIIRFMRQEYRSAMENWQHYWHWKRNRNPVRGALEEEVGYDTKNASHLMRLLLTGRDALRDGFLTVRRPEADFLLDIRRGRYNYDEIIAMSEQARAELEEAKKKSSLPPEVDRDLLRELAVGVYRAHAARPKNAPEEPVRLPC